MSFITISISHVTQAIRQFSSSLNSNSGAFVIFQGPLVVKIQSLGDPLNNAVDELAKEGVDPSQGVQDILRTLIKDYREGNGTFQRFHIFIWGMGGSFFLSSVIDFWPSIWNWSWEQTANHTPKLTGHSCQCFRLTLLTPSPPVPPPCSGALPTSHTLSFITVLFVTSHMAIQGCFITTSFDINYRQQFT